MTVVPRENQHARLRLDFDHSHLSSGGTASKPMKMLQDYTAVFAAILSTIEAVVLSVSTNLNISFLRKPQNCTETCFEDRS